MLRAIALPAFALLLVLGCADEDGHETAPEPKNTVASGNGERIDAYFTRAVPFGFSGAVLVATKDGVVLEKGYGLANRSTGIPNDSDTVFSVGSITKQFTAAAIMKLEMMGRLNTDDLISKYLPGVPEDKQNITIHHLLTHTAGFGGATGPDFVIANRDETVAKALAEELEFEPGSDFSYSNTGYSLAAAIVEMASQANYEEFLHENLFRPAGMEHTGYRLPEWENMTVANWYARGTDNGTPLGKPYPYWNLLGNGGILSTLGDLYRWHLALMGNVILSEEVKKKLYTPFLNDYAYGWDFLETDRGVVIQHDGGSMFGANAEFRRYIDAGVVTIVLCNRLYMGEMLFSAVRDPLERLAFGEAFSLPPEVTPTNIDPALYIGSYRTATGKHLQIKSDEDGLVLFAEGQEAVSLLSLPNERASEAKELSQRSENVLVSLAEGDWEILGEWLAEVDRLERYRGRITQRAGGEEGLGDLMVVGTGPTWWNQPSVLATYISKASDPFRTIFRFHWEEGRIVGLGGSAIPHPAPTQLVPKEESSLVGYHLGIGKATTIALENAEGATRIVLSDGRATLEGSKVEDP